MNVVRPRPFVFSRRVAGRLLAAAAVLGVPVAFGALAPAALAVPVEVDLAGLRAIQMNSDSDKQDDTVYLLVDGVAKGKAIEQAKLPKDATWPTNRRKPAVDTKKPVALWTGDLADGEFAALTVSVFQGEGKADDANLKAYTAKVAAAIQKAAPPAKFAAQEDLTKTSAALLKANREVVTDIKKTFSRDKKTDHFGGQFTVVTWNHGGKIVNRVDPVGLTFGEHYGIKEKIYTKIKLTRQNVLVQDESGDWGTQQLPPVSDDEATLRVKMEEAEMVGPEKKKVVDYVAEVQVKADGKPILWSLGGETLGISDLHTYWEWAESKAEKAKK